MSTINHETKEIALKVVLWGPHFAGKSTILRYIHARTNDEPFEPTEDEEPLPDDAEEGISLVDYLPLRLGDIRGYHVKMHLYATCERPFVPFESLSMLAAGADGFVIVLDSAPAREPHNLRSLELLREACAARAIELTDVAVLVACNKRDLPDAAPLPAMRALHDPSWDVVELVANQGHGVFEMLKHTTRDVLSRLRRE